MKGSFILLACLLFFSTTGLKLFAGYSGNGVTAVPITEEEIDKDVLDEYDRRKERGQPASYPPFEVVPQARVDQLKRFPPFSSLSDREVRERVRSMRRALACLTELISLDDQETGFGLARLMRYRKICFGLIRGENGVGMSILPDGTSDFGAEPINIFYQVEGDLDPAGPGLFELYVALSHESLHARQTIMRPTGRPDFRETVDLQCREVEAHQGEMERICEMQRIIASIKANGTIPSDARGGLRRFGAQLIRAEDRAELLPRWETKLREMKSVRGHLLTFREIYKEAGQATLDGDLDAAEIRRRLLPYREWVQKYGGSRDFRRITGVIYGTTPTLEGDRGNRSVNPTGGDLKQLIAPGFVPEEIDVPLIDIVCDGQYDGSGEFFYLVGVADGSTDGRLCRYQVDQANGALQLETFETCLISPQLGRGGDLVMNPFASDDPFYFVASGSADICQFFDTNDDGCPDDLECFGALPQAPNLTVGWSQFIDENTLCGYPEMPGSVPHLSQTFCQAVRGGPGEVFEGDLILWQDEIIVTPAPGADPFAGARFIPCVGTPGESFEVQLLPPGGPPEVIGTGIFSWKGGGRPLFDSPLEGGQSLQIVDSSGRASPVFDCLPDPGPAPFPMGEPFVSLNPDGSFEVAIGARPGQVVTPQFAPDPGGPWDDLPGRTVNCHGEAVFDLIGPGDPGSPPTGFFRFQSSPPPGPPDRALVELEAIPGVPTNLDLFSGGGPCLRFEVIEEPDLNEVLFEAHDDGTMTVTLLTFGGPVEFVYREAPAYPDLPFSPLVSVIVSPISEFLCNPEPYEGEGGELWVNPVTLPYQGDHYPLCQFLLANSPLDLCEDPHWHNARAFGSLVYPLENPGVGKADPEPTECGFGIFPELTPNRVRMPLADWDVFHNFDRSGP